LKLTATVKIPYVKDLFCVILRRQDFATVGSRWLGVANWECILRIYSPLTPGMIAMENITCP
jgi:hypothetical protein